MAPPTKSTKQATRGAKQIVEENESTINFYRNMLLSSTVIHLVVTYIFFQFDALTIGLGLMSGAISATGFFGMKWMATPKYSESGQLLDTGIDLNMEGGVAEHLKDLIILTASIEMLSFISNYFWLLWIAAPARVFYMLWINFIGPWIFAPAPEANAEVNDKKQKKLERKERRMQAKPGSMRSF
ncbi:unnamed protein product [Trichogramma brassicae]|uniref:Transmembrane protein 208 n=1 Tax=Trichogramma brassicae TaxID=86971 RepID=A0A6H5I3I1_9HYME|nr:unnamed protein product [Trichogramma brassicae]